MATSPFRNVAEILKTSQQRAFSTGILTAILVAVLAWGSLRPTIVTIFETNQKFNEKTTYLNALKKQNSSLTRLVSQKNDNKVALTRLNIYHPADGNYALFISNLDKIVQKYNFKLNNVSFSETATRQFTDLPAFQYESFTPVTFQMSIEGNAALLDQLCSYLENTPYLPKVTSINYAPTASGKTNVSLIIVLYKLTTPIE